LFYCLINLQTLELQIFYWERNISEDTYWVQLYIHFLSIRFWGNFVHELQKWDA